MGHESLSRDSQVEAAHGPNSKQSAPRPSVAIARGAHRVMENSKSLLQDISMIRALQSHDMCHGPMVQSHGMYGHPIIGIMDHPGSMRRATLSKTPPIREMAFSFDGKVWFVTGNISATAATTSQKFVQPHWEAILQPHWNPQRNAFTVVLLHMQWQE